MPHRGTSNEYPQHIFSWRNKKITIPLDWKRHLIKKYGAIDYIIKTTTMYYHNNSEYSNISTPHWIGDSRELTRQSTNGDHFSKNLAFLTAKMTVNEPGLMVWDCQILLFWQSKTLFIIKLLHIHQFNFSFRIVAYLVWTLYHTYPVAWTSPFDYLMINILTECQTV